MRHLSYFLFAVLALSLAFAACTRRYKPIIPCEKKDFQSNHSAANLYSWGDENYIKAKKCGEDLDRINTYCIKSIQQRGAAHCKAPYDPIYKDALLESIALCRGEARSLGLNPDELLVKSRFAEEETAAPASAKADAKSEAKSDAESEASVPVDIKNDEVVATEN